MEKPPKVIMRILSVRGNCESRHVPGQEFDLTKDVSIGTAGNPGTICPALYYAVYPNLRVLRFGGTLPWEKDPNVAQVACPDPANPVVIELRRVAETNDEASGPSPTGPRRA
jgi:uncharacterized repeat protein (TIGR04076 family)